MKVQRIDVSVYRIPTDRPEADGTIAWDATTMALVNVAADLAYGFDIPLSSHTAPAIHAQIACAAPQISHIEYFYDHARIEQMLLRVCRNRWMGCYGRIHPGRV